MVKPDLEVGAFMSNTHGFLRFYIDQADDKAVIRAVPVKPTIVSHNTHRIAVAESIGDPFTVAETKPGQELPVIERPRIALSASERVNRLVRRNSRRTNNS